mmetsp:Transcript_11073/g.46156  ORF Transcript_11073/g.46156 Transcript_11073/m.46156 type:complete len:276 (-) Transcript_11073:673-1500(-)
MPHQAGVAGDVLHVLRRREGATQRDEERGARRGAAAEGDRRRDCGVRRDAEGRRGPGEKIRVQGVKRASGRRRIDGKRATFRGYSRRAPCRAVLWSRVCKTGRSRTVVAAHLSSLVVVVVVEPSRSQSLRLFPLPRERRHRRVLRRARLTERPPVRERPVRRPDGRALAPRGGGVDPRRGRSRTRQSPNAIDEKCLQSRRGALASEPSVERLTRGVQTSPVLRRLADEGGHGGELGGPRHLEPVRDVARDVREVPQRERRAAGRDGVRVVPRFRV